EPDLDWKRRKRIPIEVLKKTPKDDNSILWRGSLKVAIVTEPCVSSMSHLIFRKGKDVPWIYINVNWEPLQVPRVTEKETKTILKHSGWHLTCK
ncbi:hypothetical protein Avbf_11180, partial [Armadillidium vulgare]